MKKFIKNFKLLPNKTKTILTVGIVFALLVALPLFVWAIITQRFELRKRAASGEPVCNRELPRVDINPFATYSYPGNAIGYTVTVRNNDSTLCSPSKFTVGSINPAGWTTNYAESLTLNPEEEGHFYYSVSSASDTAVGDYSVGIGVGDSDSSIGEIHQNNTSVVHHIVSSLPLPYPPGCILHDSVVLYCTWPTPQPTPSPSAVPTGSPVPSPTATAVASTPTPTPIVTPVDTLRFYFKFAGVTDASAEGAGVRIFFERGGLTSVTQSIEARYVSNGVYKLEMVRPTISLPAGTGYTIYLKGEKHLAKKFCLPSGQSGVCIGPGNITFGSPSGSTISFDFSGVALEPGDLWPQDGKADLNDFKNVTSLFGKLCSSLTETDLRYDIDYSGCVNVKDAFLIRKTLETKYDEF